MRNLALEDLDSDAWIMQNSGALADGAGNLLGRRIILANNQLVITSDSPNTKPSEWCNMVRSKYNAWKDSKENPKISSASPVRPAHEQASPPPADSSGGGLPVEEGVEGIKKALVAGIEASLAHLDRRAVALSQERLTHDSEIRRIDSELMAIAGMQGYYAQLRHTVCET